MQKSTKFLASILIITLLLSLFTFSWGCTKKVEEKKIVKLGFIGPLTGKYAKMGIGGLNSFKLAVKQWNEKPDTKYKYEVVSFDDEGVPQKGVEVATKACSDPEIIAVAGHYNSMVAIATTDVFHKFGVVNVVWGAVLPSITYGNDYPEICRVNGTQVEQNEANAQLVVDKLGFKKFAIIYDTTDYGRGHLQYFKEALARRGITPIAEEGIVIDQKDFTTVLTKIKALNPEVIYFGGLTPEGVNIKLQMDKLGIKAQFLGTSGIKSDDFNSALGEHAEGVICMLDGAPVEKLPGGKAFMEAYNKEGYAEPPEAYGPFAYCAANILIRAIEKVGPDRAKVIEEVNKTDYEDIIGRIHFNEYGQNDVPLATPYVSQDGQWVPWDDSEYAKGIRVLPGFAYREGKEWVNPYKKP
jgi:branched-chain amino acid transport system substrate-binding protein